MSTVLNDEPVPQKVRWAVNDGLPAGITTNEPGQYIPWAQLKKEIETELLSQVEVVPAGSRVETAEFNGKKDWLVKIFDPQGFEMGHIWFGADPNNNWAWDGLVRLGNSKKESGKPVVWQSYLRYSDGTYRCIEDFL